jgi:osmotically-inducible protein OsmY
MKLTTPAKAKTVTTAAKDARRQASTTAKGAQKQASARVRTARREARRQLVRARIAAARARATGRRKASGASKKAVGAAGAAGLAAGYFLDPDSGRRRRHVARDRALALVRRGAESAREEKPAANDQDLAERVKSQIFKPADAPKGAVNVNVERGIVYLRGELERPDEIRKLVEDAGAVDGVAGVENLLHTR